MQIQEFTQEYLSPLTEEIKQEPFEYRESKPRLGYYRALISRNNPDLDRIIEYFTEWVSYDEYLIFRKENIYTFEKEYKAVKAAKRGNDVYAYKLNKRLKHLDNLPQIEFFNYKDRNRKQKTRALFLTLTRARKSKTLDRNLWGARARTAYTLQNNRVMKITFHTLRHWKATMLYHQTKDIVYVQQFLGHKTINHTLKYIQLAVALFQDVGNYIVKTATTPEEATALLEQGFQKADEFDGLHLYRKPK